PEDQREIFAGFCLQLLQNDKHKLRRFDPVRGNRLSSWIHLLATRAAYDFLRSRRREPLFQDASTLDWQRAPTPDPQESCAVSQQARQVSALLLKLSERDREFFELYFSLGLSPERIAQEMGISIKTVYTKKHKIQG